MPSAASAVYGVAGEAEGRQAVACRLASETLTGPEQIAVHQAVDKADLQGLLGHDCAAGQDHLERARLADEPRQALCPAIPRYQTELDLG